MRDDARQFFFDVGYDLERLEREIERNRYLEKVRVKAQSVLGNYQHLNRGRTQQELDAAIRDLEETLRSDQ